VGRDSEPPMLAYDHVKQAFVPAGDDLTRSENEFERSVAVAGGIELSTSGEKGSGLEVEGQPTAVSDTDRRSL